MPLPQLPKSCHLIAWIRKHHLRASRVLLAFAWRWLISVLVVLDCEGWQSRVKRHNVIRFDIFDQWACKRINFAAAAGLFRLRCLLDVNTVSVDPCRRCRFRMCQRLCPWNWIAQLLLLRLLYSRPLACRLTFMHANLQFLRIFVGMLTCVKQFKSLVYSIEADGFGRVDERQRLAAPCLRVEKDLLNLFTV